jgi:hypothetical protein
LRAFPRVLSTGQNKRLSTPRSLSRNKETLEKQGWKKHGFKKKTSPVGFFGFFLVFLNIFAQKREILGFFQFQEYF